MKFVVFTGESGSGKTTIIEELVRKYPDQFKRIIEQQITQAEQQIEKTLINKLFLKP